MSNTRLSHDECNYKGSLDRSVYPSQYQMYPGKYENSSRCRMELGVMGGNGVSLYGGNLVDLESDLRGITRKASKCNENSHKPSDGDKQLVHQPSCQMHTFRSGNAHQTHNFN